MIDPSQKLQQALILANQLKTIAEKIVDRLELLTPQSNFRERILAGLALKMYRSFECLIRDCEDQRLESMHHLRPIVETYIYYMWVARDSGAIRAQLIHTKGISEKLKFFRENPDYPDAPAYISTWEDFLNKATIGIQDEWIQFKNKKVESIADEAEISDWYRRAYRLACEPTHLTDLMSHVPSDLRLIDLGNPKDSIFWANIALDYSLWILIGVFSGVCQQYSLGLENDINSISTRLTDLRKK